MNRPDLRKEALLLVAYLALLVLPAAGFPGPWGKGRLLLLLFWEAALLAVAAPAARSAITVAALAVVSGIAAAAIGLGAGAPAVLAGILGQVVMLAWGMALHGWSRVLGRAIGDRAASLLVAGAGLLIILGPYGLDPVLDAAGGRARGEVLHLALLLHPSSSVASSLLGVDWIREGSLYGRARFPSTDAFAYPSWGVSASLLGAMAGIGLAADAAAWRWRRGRRPSLTVRSGVG